MHTLETYCFSETAVRKGIVNVLPEALKLAAEFTLQNVRIIERILGFPVRQSSGYRCEQLNTSVQGKKNRTKKISQHVKAEAIDFTCPEFGTPKQIMDKILQSGLEFDQLIEEGTWVHISFTLLAKQRMQVLATTFVNGEAKYTELDV